MDIILIILVIAIIVAIVRWCLCVFLVPWLSSRRLAVFCQGLYLLFGVVLRLTQAVAVYPGGHYPGVEVGDGYADKVGGLLLVVVVRVCYCLHTRITCITNISGITSQRYGSPRGPVRR